MKLMTRMIMVWLLLCSALTARADSQAYALTNGHIFDGVKNRIVDDVTVLIADGTIERLAAASSPLPADYEVIDLDGFYLMPGMFDVHTHLTTIDQARRALESGVTTVRSASVKAYQDVALQALVEMGALAGPEVFAPTDCLGP